METWAQATFPMNVSGLVVYTDSNASIMVDPSVFGGSSFSAITTTPPAYTSLSILPIAQQGWQKIFDQWKANGLVS